jgi:hypothetical protein
VPCYVLMIVFACVFGGPLFGMLLRGVLHEHQLSADSKDTVRMGMGLIGTLTALVLGLLIASAKNFYDTQSNELTEMSAKIVLLDRVLAHYGPETKELRDLSQSTVTRMLDGLWPKDPGHHPQMEPTSAGGEILYDKIQELSPRNDTQRSLQARKQHMRWTKRGAQSTARAECDTGYLPRCLSKNSAISPNATAVSGRRSSNWY